MGLRLGLQTLLCARLSFSSSLSFLVIRQSSHCDWRELSKSVCWRYTHNISNKNKVHSTQLQDKIVEETVKTMDTTDCDNKTDLKQQAKESIELPVSQNQAGKEGDKASKPLSNRALKKLARAQRHKELKKKKKEKNLLQVQKDDPGYSLEDLDESSYYFENGLRKVYPYNFVFGTHAKGRWVNRTLHNVLETEFGFDSPEDLTRAFDNGMIHVNSKRVREDYVLQHNDFISHRLHRHENPVTAAPLEVLENNDDVVVINKPSSIPCHPCGRYRFNSVVFILGKEHGLTSLRNIYRLDRLTSGVLILGKSAERTRMLMDQVANRQVQKEYLCRVVGKFPDGTIKVDQPLEPLSNKLRLQVVSSTGKASQTTFMRLSYNGTSSVVRCIPHTGRTHQIRVHLQYLGHPITNDVFYNNEAWGPNKGKDGIYEVPFDKVCEKILSEHHVTLWDGGANPLYEQKLKEQEAGKADNGSIDKNASDEIVLDSTSVETLKPGEKEMSTSIQRETSSPSAKASDDEPPCKRRKETGSENCAEENDASSSKLTTNTTEEASAENETTLQQTQGTQDSTNCTDVIDASRECSTSQGETQAHSDQHPGFEMSKWQVDPMCELCKKRPIDPQEKNLVMFLHAIKYKGPGWEYSTALPDWAREDWNKEEEYKIDGVGNFDL